MSEHLTNDNVFIKIQGIKKKTTFYENKGFIEKFLFPS